MSDFAVQYRPTRFAEVVGQTAVVKTLMKMLKNGNLPATILLSGPRSTGKTTLSRLVAAACNCQNLQDGEICGECKSCVTMLRVIQGTGEHPDVIEKNAASERGIDAIRALETLARYKPLYRHRVIILDEAHAITDQAFQAGLKLFEEPPSRQTKFILCTTNKEKLPGTILSRCAQFALEPIEAETTAKLLHRVCRQEKRDVAKEVLLEISSAVQGHPREALHLLSQVLDAGPNTIDLSNLPAIFEQSETTQPYVAVQKFLSAVLDGKRGNALLALRKVTAHEYFVNLLLEAMRLVLSNWIAPEKLSDPTKQWLLRGVVVPPRDLAIQHLADYTMAMKVGLDAQERIKRYLACPTTTMEVMALEMAAIFAGWKA